MQWSGVYHAILHGRHHRKKGAPGTDRWRIGETVQRLITALEGQSLKYGLFQADPRHRHAEKGDACSLRWSDIDWRQRALHIRRNVVKLSWPASPGERTEDPCGGCGGISVERTLQTASCLAKRKCVWEKNSVMKRGWRKRGLSVFRQPARDPMVPVHSFSSKVLRRAVICRTI